MQRLLSDGHRAGRELEQMTWPGGPATEHEVTVAPVCPLSSLSGCMYTLYLTDCMQYCSALK